MDTALTTTTGWNSTTGQYQTNDYYPYYPYPHTGTGYGYIQTSPTYYFASPTECSGDIHVFPCPHCEKCKCGAATVKRNKK